MKVVNPLNWGLWIDTNKHTHWIETMRYVLLCFFLFPACYLETTGEQEQLTFGYEESDQQLNFDRPLGVDHTLTLQVKAVGTGEHVALTSVTEDSGALEVTDFGVNLISLKGVKEGVAVLKVTAFSPDTQKTLTDQIKIRVKPRVFVEVQAEGDREEGGPSEPSYLAGAYFRAWVHPQAHTQERLIGQGYIPNVTSEWVSHVKATPASSFALIQSKEGTQGRQKLYIEGMKEPKVLPFITLQDTGLRLMSRESMRPEHNAWAWEGLSFTTDFPLVKDGYIVAGGNQAALEAKSLTPEVCTAKIDLTQDFTRLKGIQNTLSQSRLDTLSPKAQVLQDLASAYKSKDWRSFSSVLSQFSQEQSEVPAKNIVTFDFHTQGLCKFEVFAQDRPDLLYHGQVKVARLDFSAASVDAMLIRKGILGPRFLPILGNLLNYYAVCVGILCIVFACVCFYRMRRKRDRL